MNHHYVDGTHYYHNNSKHTVGVSTNNNDFLAALDNTYSDPPEPSYHCNFKINNGKDEKLSTKEKEKAKKPKTQNEHVYASQSYADDGIRVSESKTETHEAAMDIEMNDSGSKRNSKPSNSNISQKKPDHYNLNGCKNDAIGDKFNKLSDAQIGSIMGNLYRADDGYAQFIVLAKAIHEINPNYLQCNL
jgi:hypothetical protein